MKNLLVVGLLLSSLTLISGHAYAHETIRNDPFVGEPVENVYDSMVKKFFRGVVNVGTCWIEIPRQLCLTTTQDGLLVGLIAGPVKGIFMTITRAGYGVYDGITFFSAAPGNFDPLIHPEYVWQPNVVRYLDTDSHQLGGKITLKRACNPYS